MAKRKQILLTNDDGYESEGLHALIEALTPLGDITVVAPSTEKSACGHSLTLTKPLHFIEIRPDFYKLDDGTPSDCIFLALGKFFAKQKPDIIISGINVGSNMGEDITYSGTASAAMEAALHNIPGIAISQVYAEHGKSIDEYGYALAQEVIVTVTKKILDGDFPLPPRKFLNINVPPISPAQSQGFKITRAGNRRYAHNAEVHHNPRGKEYYWIGLPELSWLDTEGHITDFEAVTAHYVSITPVKLDMTSHEDIARLEKWL
jgi:5'-nucleotidase